MRARVRAWVMLIGAAVVTAAVGWWSYGRARDRIDELTARFGIEGDWLYGVLDPVVEGFWILFALFAALGAGALAGGHLMRVLGRSEPKDVDTAQQLGPYTLEEQLGEGAMGSVFRARHHLLRRPTAIKLLRAERRSDERALRRFEREVQMTSRLMHPNTVAVYDYGHTSEGVFYYAMEFIEGITLEALVAELGPLPPARVIYILKQVCGSLAEAHEVGLIHRDIKPANIMLCEQGGESDVVKVLDFGLVKEAGDASSSITMGDGLAGTPLYASPEAIRSSREVEPRSDLYSLGAVAYYLLTGAWVFEGQTVLEICTKHMTEEPVPPSARTGVQLSAELEGLIMACLNKQPEDRPSGARELRTGLVECIEGADWGQGEARAWWQQHRALLPVAGTVARRQSRPVALATLTIDVQARTPDAP